jgi:hypothetical protein
MMRVISPTVPCEVASHCVIISSFAKDLLKAVPSANTPVTTRGALMDLLAACDCVFALPSNSVGDGDGLLICHQPRFGDILASPPAPADVGNSCSDGPATGSSEFR